MESSPALSVRRADAQLTADAQPRFLCDEMLQRLGRWLRAAGYDTQIATDAQTDYYLITQAIHDNRILLTRDQQLSQHRRAQGHVILLRATKLDECAAELNQHFPINWLLAPFSRCLICNTPMLNATPQQHAHIPPASRQHVDKALYCPTCKQVFWDGGHVKRMRRHLEKWQESIGSRITYR